MRDEIWECDKLLKSVVFLFSVLMSFSVCAEDMRIYETEVEVDATDVNAATAREKAMKEANRKALYAVTNRISTASSTEILDNLNDNQILNFIREVAVVSEKVTGARYMATLKLTINAPVLKAYLQEKNAPVKIMPENHVLIVPVFRAQAAATPQLWNDGNAWYGAWRDNAVESGQITIRPAPRNDEVAAEDALSLNRAKLELLGGNVCVAEAVVTENGVWTELKSPLWGVLLSRQYEGAAPEVFGKIIEDMKAAIMQQIQQQALAAETARSSLTMVFNYNALRDWLELQKSLKNIPVVTNTNIDAMGSRRVQLTIEYTGDFDALLDKFMAQGWRLNNSGNFYNIERI